MNEVTHLFTHAVSFVIGVLLLIVVTVSLLRIVVVPRPLRSNFSDAVSGLVIGTTRLVARTRRSYQGKDSVLSWGGPILIIALLISWLLGYLVAYTFLEYGASTDRTLTQAFRQAGSNLFTLGLGGDHDTTLTVIDFMAAATGPIVIAMLIGFLPAVYSSYLDRERIMAEISVIGGEPIWAPEWLARASVSKTLDSLMTSFPAYADWATNLRMTHCTYPVLFHIRSPRFTRHSITTLLAVLDAANLLASLGPRTPDRRLFLMILNGSQALEIMYVLFFSPRSWRSRIPIVGRLLDPVDDTGAHIRAVSAWERSLTAVHLASARDSARGMGAWRLDDLQAGEDRPTSLTRADFDAAVEMLREAGLPIERDIDEAWAMFRALRTRYEFTSYEMARQLTAVPAPWSGPRNGVIETMWPASVVQIVRDDEVTGDRNNGSDSGGS